MLGAVQLSPKVYASCGGGGLRCIVVYRRSSLNCQKADRVKPLNSLPLSFYDPTPAPAFVLVPCRYSNSVLSLSPYIVPFIPVSYFSGSGSMIPYTVKKSCAKFRCGQQWRGPNDMGVGKFLPPHPLGLRHCY
jgi:hypothetical protein